MEAPPKLLIIKTGDTLPELKSQRGDFEDWILAGMQVRQEESIIADVPRGAELPAYNAVNGVAITGSHAMVTDHYDWSERSAEWLRGAVERGIPVLGICYGHQLLAYALDGVVENNPNGWEYGTAEIKLTPEAQNDPLFHGFPGSLKMQVSHTQSVTTLPPGATVLASGTMDPHQAFVVRENAYGVQFHPEFDAEIVRAYIRKNCDVLVKEGQNPEELIEACSDNEFGKKLLRRWAYDKLHKPTEDESSGSKMKAP